MIELLGNDVPDNNNPGHFKWCDGVVLKAMKEGAWLIIDEMNLAS